MESGERKRVEEIQLKFATLLQTYLNHVKKFVDTSRKSMARTIVVSTTRVTNSPELNHQLREGPLERMMGRPRSDEYIQQLMASKAISASSGKKKDLTTAVSKGLNIVRSPSKSDNEQVKARAPNRMYRVMATIINIPNSHDKQETNPRGSSWPRSGAKATISR